MKKRCQTGVYLLLYVLLLTYVSDFDIKRLLDIKSFFLLLAGTLLLAIPFYHREINRDEFLYIYGTKTIEAGLIQVFLLCFVQLSENQNYEQLLPEVALCFRPMLYAFCIRLILVNEDMKDFLPDTTENENKKTPAAEQHTMPTHEECRMAGLTRRETEIALLICQKYSNREIADILVISETTVKKHISNIFEKTGIGKREELAYYLTHISSND